MNVNEVKKFNDRQTCIVELTQALFIACSAGVPQHMSLNFDNNYGSGNTKTITLIDNAPHCSEINTIADKVFRRALVKALKEYQEAILDVLATKYHVVPT